MNTNRSLERSLDLLECFSELKPKIGLSELARLVGLPKATVFRMAETLAQRGYLAKNPGEQSYQLGYRILGVGKVLLASLDYRNVALPYMRRIKEETNESVTIYIAVNERERLCVERVQSTQGLSRMVYVGDLFPIDRGAAGKALLAFQAPQNLLADYAVSVSELEMIRKNLYAESHAERETGVSSVASPIFDHKGKMIAVLSLSGPSFRYQGEQLAKFIEIIKDAAANISRELGYPFFAGERR